MLQAIDKRNKAVIGEMDKRLKAMTSITKSFNASIKKLNDKRKKQKAAVQKPKPEHSFINASGGIGRWASNKFPAMRKCGRFGNVTCLP